MIEEFSELFQEPSQPQSSQDHYIHLKLGSQPVLVRPYRYPQFKKGEIERLVKDMIKQGLIRNSTSPYSSPVFLVKKKDGGFRLCVDYMTLNALIIRDNF